MTSTAHRHNAGGPVALDGNRRLSKLGWTQKEIGCKLGVTQGMVAQHIKKSHLGKMYKDLGPGWNDKGIAKLANRVGLPLTDLYVNEDIFRGKWNQFKGTVKQQ